MDERLKFVARLLDGEKMAVLCREFGISRKTGYKLFRRYRDFGLDGLTDRSRRPNRQAGRLPFQVESRIVQLKKEHPSWGAPKIREKLRRMDLGVQTPAISTVHAVLDRHGLVTRRRRHRPRAQGTALSQPLQPNDLWCADYKGEFMLADHRYCYPLTVSDSASRFLLACDALSSTAESFAFVVFERTFKDFGLPRAIRTDNGVPFACPRAVRLEQALRLGTASPQGEIAQPLERQCQRKLATDLQIQRRRRGIGLLPGLPVRYRSARCTIPPSRPSATS